MNVFSNWFVFVRVVGDQGYVSYITDCLDRIFLVWCILDTAAETLFRTLSNIYDGFKYINLDIQFHYKKYYQKLPHIKYYEGKWKQ